MLIIYCVGRQLMCHKTTSWLAVMHSEDGDYSHLVYQGKCALANYIFASSLKRLHTGREW